MWGRSLKVLLVTVLFSLGSGKWPVSFRASEITFMSVGASVFIAFDAQWLHCHLCLDIDQQCYRYYAHRGEGVVSMLM